MACAVSGVKLHDAYIMGDTMAISKDKLLKELTANYNRLLKEEYETVKVNQIIANEEQSVKRRKELEHLIQAGKTFRDAVKTAHIIENEKRLKEIEDAILNDRLQVVAKAGTMGGKTARVLRNEQKKKELEDAIQEQSR